MKSYPQAIAFLYALQYRGMKFGLRGIRGLLKDIGNPERRFSSIHVAGSNGKGSTAAMIASVLTASGYHTGLYTSPHLVDFRERIQIDGVPVSRRTVLTYMKILEPFVERRKVTFFEASTALAFRYFAERGVDVAVVETGLGGRLDATNVLEPLLSVITTISLEHTRILGNSLRKIAYEKSGIVKSGIPCVTGVRSSSALKIIRATCRRKKSELVETGGVRPKVHVLKPDGSSVSFVVGNTRLRRLRLDLPGRFQVHNAVTAVASLKMLAAEGMEIRERSIRAGMSSVRTHWGFQGRLSVFRTHPAVMMDVAHNPEAISWLVKSLKELHIRAVTLVFGVMQDKQLSPMVEALSEITRLAVAVQPETSRAVAAGVVEREFRKIGVPAQSASSVREGLHMARLSAGKNGIVLVTGSHFVVGEAMAALKRKKYLTINQ